MKTSNFKLNDNGKSTAVDVEIRATLNASFALVVLSEDDGATTRAASVSAPGTLTIEHVKTQDGNRRESFKEPRPEGSGRTNVDMVGVSAPFRSRLFNNPAVAVRGMGVSPVCSFSSSFLLLFNLQFEILRFAITNNVQIEKSS